jgi:glutathione S-transferase
MEIGIGSVTCRIIHSKKGWKNAMPDHDLTLYVDARLDSPYALSVFVALAEKRLVCQIKPVDLKAGRQFESDYQRLSLTCRVPTLVHEGFALSESAAICEYLEEEFPAPEYPSAYPSSPRARQIQAWLRSDLAPLREERPTTVIFHERSATPLSERAQESAEKLIQVAHPLLHEDAEHLFNSWCIADTDLAIMLCRLVLNGDRVPDELANYAKRQWQRPAVQAWVSTPQRNCIGGPEQKSVTAASKKAPDIGGLLAFAFQSGGVASGAASGRGRRDRRLEWARR